MDLNHDGKKETVNFEQTLLGDIGRQMKAEGFLRVETNDMMLQAWVDGIVEDRDWKVPLLVSFVPIVSGDDDDRILQICFTLVRNITPENLEKLAPKLNELNAMTDVGSLLAMPTGEISYQYQMPVHGLDVETAYRDFALSLELMLAFIYRYYVYVMILSEDPDRITVEQYLEAEV